MIRAWLARLRAAGPAPIPPAPADTLGAATLPPADTRGQPVPEPCVALVAKWEGFQADAYLCPAGVWTIGYGATYWPSGQRVRQGETIGQAQAMVMLRDHLADFARQVDATLRVPVSAGERGALISLAYNIGVGAFSRSTLLRTLNAGRRAEAADQFAVWNRGGGRVLPGLVSRRADEVAMFRG